MDPFSLFLLWFLFGCRSGGGAAPAPAGMPGGEPGWPGSPISYTPPWPQVVPTTGLPKFPGSAWEFDEPPPAAVQQRARQLVDVLWKQGSGAYRVEQTAGRWIAYQAQVVASGKKGVVAYRQKAALPASPAAPAMTAARTAARPAARPTAPAAARPQAARPAPVSPPPAARAPSQAPPARAVPVATTPSPTSPVSLPVLQRGAGIKPKAPSPNVKLLQQRLGIAADGQFGGGTETAVKAFQTRNGLAADGIVGPKTWTALFAQSRV